MSDPDLLILLGVKTQDFVAGAMGGIVKALVFDRNGPAAVVTSMICGALTANYFGEYAAKETGTSGGAAAFLVGMCAMVICQVVISSAPKLLPNFLRGGTRDEP